MIINGDNGNNNLTGTNAVDTINGLGGNDIIDGRDGADTLIGGSGHDTFRYIDIAHLDSGETISGGSGLDKLQLDDEGIFDFRNANLSGIEEVEFDGSDDTTARFNSSQIGVGLSSSLIIDGHSAPSINQNLRIDMNSISVNLSALSFFEWNGSDDHVYIYGSTANNMITGSSVNDTIYGESGNNTINGGIGNDDIFGGNGDDIIQGGAGRDTLNGGLGNDTFLYTAPGELVVGEFISGNLGDDKIQIWGGGIYDFRGTSIYQIDEIEFTTTVHSEVYLCSTNVGRLGSGTTIEGNLGGGVDNYLRVFQNLGTVDLSGFNFVNWIDNASQITIFGRISDESITGSDQADTIYGYDGADFIRGHEGRDVLFGGLGNDIFLYYASNEVEDGEIINGDSGVDEIEIRGFGIFDFTKAALDSIEEIEFFTGHDNVVSLNSSQLGAEFSNTGIIYGNSTAGAENEFRVYVNSAFTDLTGLTFESWFEADDDVVVVGTLGADTVNGTHVGDTMYGYNGNDVFRGLKGDDYLDGGEGDDMLFGGNGHDVVWSFTGTNFLLGGKGNDRVYGGDGVDTMYGNIGADWLYGNAGDDVIFGGGWVDRVFGGSGNDTIHGNYGNDQLYGDAGDDHIMGGYGLDVIHGGAGNDQIYGGGFTDQLYGDAGNDTIWNGGGNDTGNGGAGADVIYGEGGNDTLYGNGDDDDLYGGAGSDTLVGGHGNDNLWGGDGSTDDGTLDRFVFASTIGHDRIHDFENGIDRIDFSGNATFNSFATVSANAVQVGANVIITQNVNNTLRIDDMNLADLDASDFIF